MKKFSFGLETLLRYRKSLEEKELEELSRIQASVQRERERAEELRTKARETSIEAARRRGEFAQEEELVWYYRYLDRLETEIQKSQERLASLEQEIQKKRAEVIEASKKKKILDTLKGRKEKEFISALDRQEEQEVGDLVVTRFPREKT